MGAKPRITARKYMGDDTHSWAVFIDGRPFVTGLTRREVPYYKKEAQATLDKRERNCRKTGEPCCGAEAERRRLMGGSHA